MRIHALESTGGLTYAQMPRYATADGKGTNDPAKAAKGPSGRPIDNPARDVWITETALATALNVSYMATQLSLFSLVVGVALLLAGIGFIILAALARCAAERPPRLRADEAARPEGVPAPQVSFAETPSGLNGQTPESATS
jgi:hypothetical protein